MGRRCAGLLGAVLVVAGCAHARIGGGEDTGMASFYHPSLEGHRTANGGVYRGAEMTCAHRTLPFGTRLRVTDLSTGRSVDVMVNDRGPYVAGRVVDLSHEAARRLGILDRGVAKVRVERLN